MSVENVKKFYEALVQDKMIQQRFNELNQKYQGMAMDAAKADAIMEQDLLPLAKELGYEFTLAEIKIYGDALKQTKMQNELIDEEMEAVAGGGLICVGVGFNEDVRVVIDVKGYCVLLGFNDTGGFCFLIGAGTK